MPINKWFNLNKNRQKIIIVGAGSLGLMTADIVKVNEAFSNMSVAVADDNIQRHGDTVLDFPIIGSIDEVAELGKREESKFVLAIANNKVRKRIAQNHFDLDYINVIHPRASVSKFSSIGKGNIILPNVSIDPDAVIEDHVIVNKNASIGHNGVLRSFSQVCPGVSLGGTICEGAFLGLNATVLPYKKVGENTIVGAGSVVIKDLPANCTAVGSPAFPIKYHKE
ncbi:acetyltransferase [Halalkalibacterium halodurans]|uniref:acetyltransferase n=1 Tax=Halalkalibacterium halodurans TaxID=86665 RepID=UPI002AAA0660|nr:acetyltransferase [Halalkalibacterium halodurans]MDY7224215.1 acetyltransferase [Halalkalibacterium halodurans]MDY7243500.1 acetyltransferase [Halalkalibacterium halodurans]